MGSAERTLRAGADDFGGESLEGCNEMLCLTRPDVIRLTRVVLDRLVELGDYRFNIVTGERAQFLWTDWLDEEAVRTWLDTVSPEDRSGDLFASLDPL